jgi:hypothetical protein
MSLRKNLSAAMMLAASTLSLHAHSAPILDQSDGAPFNAAAGFLAASGIDIAQTFTVGLAGTLSLVSVNIARTADTTAPLFVEIRTTVGGIPNAMDGQVLLSTPLSAALVPIAAPTTAGPLSSAAFAFINVDLSAFGLAVTPGEILALSMTSDAVPGGYLWGLNVPGTYAGGSSYFRGNGPDVAWMLGGADQNFRTFVSLPEPASLALVAIALASLMAIRRRAPARRSRT